MTHMKLIMLAMAALAIAACNESKPPSGPPVVVYASEIDPTNLSELFAAFTEDTGIPVAPQWGKSSQNTDTVIGKVGLPADVLITPNIADIWRAADQGALRPINADAIAAVPSALKDPDRLWVALQHRPAVIVFSEGTADSSPPDYASLGAPSYQGTLCLSSVNNSMNQVLIAMLIDEVGLKRAERIVRAWVRNLAEPPFKSEADLYAALIAGRCSVGILSALVNTSGLPVHSPDVGYFDVSAMGVGRHAQSAERAQQLVAWLVEEQAPGSSLSSSPMPNVAIAGWRHEEVLLLADRAGYR